MAEEHPPDWHKIVERHAERVFRIAYRILGSVHDAEDVSQLVFIEAKRVQEAGPIQSWSGLFARLATTRAIDLARRRRKVLDEEKVSGTFSVDTNSCLRYFAGQTKVGTNKGGRDRICQFHWNRLSR